MSEVENVIEIKNLVKQYPSATSPAVNDFTLDCCEGEIVGLLGHNGAGKSTTLKCLTGILPFTSGEIRINGYDIKTSPIKAKASFGFVSDKHDVFVKMTGIQYVNFMADAYGISKSERAARLGELESVFSLGDKIFEPISNYSHGMRQKICMLASLIHRPKLWILDEPMIGLDPHTAASVADFMKEYAKEGNCILFSSHNVNSVQRICERAVIINNGIKTDDFRFDDFNLKGEELEDYFLSRTAASDRGRTESE
ncbi:MAG: ABC transporter ATP-binding protein [Bacteroides sp.]|nr:ABC transporter ATP-binding protein [Bacillota bacterium]MCM1393329.1 ABC transporter ATP-binding protein [[Eubacterium] siraeum]MCM1455911.1 ABC transporter ATP-binding protein [Bacteroides sp.]